MLNEVDVKKVFFETASSSPRDPFPEKLLEKAREKVLGTLRRFSDTQHEKLAAVAEGQPFLLTAIGETLRFTGDPDWRVFATSSESFATGVRIGCNQPLPRTPAVCER